MQIAAFRECEAVVTCWFPANDETLFQKLCKSQQDNAKIFSKIKALCGFEPVTIII